MVKNGYIVSYSGKKQDRCDVTQDIMDALAYGIFRILPAHVGIKWLPNKVKGLQVL